MSDLLKLAERCEAATGPDQALDDAIWLAVKADALSLSAYNEGLKISEQEAAFRLDYMAGGFSPTHSLDAAMTLVPEGWGKLCRDDEDRGAFARVYSPDFDSMTFGKGGDWITEITAGQEVKAFAATWPLALCAASLRARQALSQEEGE